MSEDATHRDHPDQGAGGRPDLDTVRRRREAALTGHAADEPAARALLRDPAPSVRASALGALGRMRRVSAVDIAAALADEDPAVRRRACEVAAGAVIHDRAERNDDDVLAALVATLHDPDATVVEVGAWAVGERASGPHPVPPGPLIEELARVATSHDDPMCRESAVAALGAIGDERGLPTILAATRDRPAVRRRAVLALAPFRGPEVDEALARASADRDWQVRQAAEDLLREG